MEGHHHVLPGRPPRDELVEEVVALVALRVVSEVRVLGQPRLPEHRGEADPGLVVGDREGQPAVIAPAAVDPLGGLPGVPVANPLRWLAPLGLDEHVSQLGHDVLQLGKLDHLAAPRGLAIV